ncbi:NAD(P)-dependent oxidoreductase [Flavobacterium pectinovorum]|uniref:NAD(P)-dependent oxidoreductase n=1 Tax=Flavobacterium pectinovorum TaxID=29533 RepID=UPI001FACD51C|nr:NAD(P)H-binding protein [Flavobacterium pectinovorum]MCI9843560.1 NAD(P)H-binding protein [Flavobacterium pectinovorum]
MKVIVFGATGLVGKQIVKESLKLGNEVTVYTRQTGFPINGVKIISGELDDESKIAEIIKDYDAIACAIANRDLEDPTQVLTPFVKLVTKHISKEQRFIVVAGSGLTLLNFNTLRRDLPGQPAFLKNPRADHWDAYTYLGAIDVNYLVVCPTMIIEGDSDGNYLFEEKYFPKSESKEIFAGNVGHYIAKELNEQSFKQTKIGLVNKG